MGLKIYKRGQGYYTRLYSALVAFGIVATGCYALYRQLQGMGNIWVEAFVPASVCAIFSWLIFWIVNKPNIADFMISAEGEIKKVSWSSRKEIIASTMVVIFVVAFMACTLRLADFCFRYLFDVIFKIYG
jgi:preprotein translocase subunit SecE